MSFDLIIWDCDGCLVDSEVIACEAIAEYFGELGYPLSVEDAIARFVGRNDRDTLAEIEKETGRPFTKLFSKDVYKKKVFEMFEASLKPIAGVAEALERLGGARCIASGSSISRIKYTLELTDLASFFDAQQIFSAAAEDLGPNEPRILGKPAPDIFLHAAERMGFSPAQCLVIEDSAHGIEGAKAAGMAVFAYTGASHATSAWVERLQLAEPHALFKDMRELPGLVARVNQ